MCVCMSRLLNEVTFDLETRVWHTGSSWYCWGQSSRSQEVTCCWSGWCDLDWWFSSCCIMLASCGHICARWRSRDSRLYYYDSPWQGERGAVISLEVAPTTLATVFLLWPWTLTYDPDIWPWSSNMTKIGSLRNSVPDIFNCNSTTKISL